MSKKLQFVGALISIVSFVVFWFETGWQVAVSLFFILWSNNMAQRK